MQLQQPSWWLLCFPFGSCPSGSVALVVVKFVESSTVHLASVDWSRAEVEDHGQAFQPFQVYLKLPSCRGHSRWCYTQHLTCDAQHAPHRRSRSRSNALTPGAAAGTDRASESLDGCAQVLIYHWCARACTNCDNMCVFNFLGVRILIRSMQSMK